MAKEKKVSLKLPFGQPQHSLFCDRYVIHKCEDFTDFDFLCDRSGQTLSIRMATEVVLSYRDRFSDYIRKAPSPESQAPGGVHIKPEIVVAADVLGLAHHGRMAEFAFHAISWQCALADEESGDGESVQSRASYFVASVRCPLELQIHWIANLFSE